jgi:hypothetical protein
MGCSVVWVAIRDIPTPEIWKRLSLEQVGAHVPPRTDFSGGLVGDWYVVFSEARALPQAGSTLTDLSVGCELVVTEVEEHCMCSSSELWSHGKRRWRVSHAGDLEKYHPKFLAESGSLPPTYVEIKSRALARQKEEDEAESGKGFRVDFIFDIPIDLAAAVTGFRHDLRDVDGFQPLVGKSRLENFLARDKQSWLSKLFGSR